MRILRFDPTDLRSQLAALDPQCRIAFAVACSFRTSSGMMPPEPLAETARQLASGYARSRNIDLSTANSILAKLDQLAELDRDDIASSYYALNAVAKDDLDSVIWSAQRAYEARDAQAQEAMEISSYTVEVEARILESLEVQSELSCQASDLDALKNGISSVPLVLQRAQTAASQETPSK